MGFLPITSFVAVIAAVSLVALSIPVTLRRMAVGVGTGTGGDQSLERRIRTQGNFIEYVPLALILLGLAESAGVAAAWLWPSAAALIIGRAAHALGMVRRSTPLRAVGMVGTYTALLVPAAALASRLV